MPGFSKLKENEREQRRDIIIKAAVKLFEEKPFHEIGMRDIAEETDIVAGTIYRYFSSRDELFVEALIQNIKDIEHIYEKRIEEARDSVSELAIGVVDYLLDNEATFQMISHFMINREIKPETLEKFNAVQRYFLKIFDNVMIREGASEEIRLITHAFFASLNGIVMTFRNYPGRSKEDIRKHMHRLALLTASMFETGIQSAHTKKKE
ncbi:MAG: TetR/AcrR family transcriptional regulator [Desulfobacteraceae bacterium]|nr:TetR/AcrR family transcriptional regulator [Desulfobacteraceae bacterium]